MNTLIATVSAVGFTPVIVASRPRKASVGSRRGAARLVADVLAAVKRAIVAIDENAWTPIKYTNAIFDEDTQKCVATAEVAEIEHIALTSREKPEHVTGRLVVRGIPDLSPKAAPAMAFWGLLHDLVRMSLVHAAVPLSFHRLVDFSAEFGNGA